MKNFLITGALGFVGSNFVNYMSLKYPHCKLIILDISDYCSSIENINKQSLHNTEIIIGDISNKELVSYLLIKFNIDTIIHFAAQSHVDNSFFNSIEFTKTNVLGTHILLETVRIYNDKTNNIEKFIHISTDEVYGEVNDNVMRLESSHTYPTSPYSASKLAAENLVQAYKYSYKLPVIITRCNNIFGINQYPEKIIPKFICNILNKKQLPIQGDGSARRNFIHVDDTCTALETILLKGEVGEIYNISSDHKNEYSVMEIAKMLLELMLPNVNLNEHITYVEDRKFNDCRYYISSEKLERLGWAPQKVNFRDELLIIIEWYKKNKSRYGF